MADYPEYWNEEMETLSPERYHDVQEKALLKQLKYVWENSAFYQKKFGEAGIELGDIKTLEDLSKLPFTEKAELRESQLEAPPLGTHIACAMEKVRRVYSTSGTTGRPTFIGVTKKDIEVWREAACRAFWTGGFRPNSIVPLVVAPFFIAASYADAIETIGTLVPIGVGATDRLIGAFQNIGANAFLATSSFPLHFAASLRKRGIDPKSLGIKVILAGGEPGAAIPSVRKEVEETFGCVFLEMMGNGDMCGQIWSECRYKRGMHFVAQGIVHPEVINPDTGEALEIKEGTKGELVYTSLDRECIPLVRFRTRDHIEVTQTSCECGRTGFGIRVFGRTDDMIIVQGVNVYPAAVRDTVASLHPRTTGAIEIQLHEPPPKGWEPPIHIKVEHGKDAGDLSSLKKELEALIREKLIFRANVELVPPDSLPKFEYKAKLVRKLYEEEGK
ncbi:MAG: phenylacetate--CoA ligase family protein [Deltaproteobacteria bacterium]|nr:phenylacetate--CoA ligase family protein [Deltaproteobacteria bacterium]MBW1977546.1 phenylacetate--CoA ligase family protein [Deltaproteobacteria bacterium]MBW2299500.1 phenylacetate--CoA ligase family protein [Deltaproteobacteria bacterium]RLB34925.1 MAG: phenylacetate--CoA ligase family protein [Deltaproteobacteria bacterium]